eukprot:TRINITY_DN38168_c0_g1_i2.p1 TRINITY_DN38168_c0_g1~~TRINITY_DN38168_c0_g1_i2.p1  ORF type:complete len:445 (-),score=-18.49 TRINITY_DN38168_c0_g1_i2:205-1446(-)
MRTNAAAPEAAAAAAEAVAAASVMAPAAVVAAAAIAAPAVVAMAAARAAPMSANGARRGPPSLDALLAEWRNSVKARRDEETAAAAEAAGAAEAEEAANAQQAAGEEKPSEESHVEVGDSSREGSESEAAAADGPAAGNRLEESTRAAEDAVTRAQARAATAEAAAPPPVATAAEHTVKTSLPVAARLTTAPLPVALPPVELDGVAAADCDSHASTAAAMACRHLRRASLCSVDVSVLASLLCAWVLGQKQQQQQAGGETALVRTSGERVLVGTPSTAESAIAAPAAPPTAGDDRDGDGDDCSTKCDGAGEQWLLPRQPHTNALFPSLSASQAAAGAACRIASAAHATARTEPKCRQCMRSSPLSVLAAVTPSGASDASSECCSDAEGMTPPAGLSASASPVASRDATVSLLS